MKNSRFSGLVGLCWLILLAAPTHADSSEALVGIYWFPDKTGQVEIVREGEQFVGRVITYDIHDQKDESNPDPQLRNKPFVGSVMFEGFRYDENDDRWDRGTIYDASEGKVYTCRLWFEGNNRERLNARGYIGVPMFGRTEIFERVGSYTADIR